MTGSASATQEQTELYHKEENVLLTRIQASLRYYSHRIKYARCGHYSVGIITLVCSVLAPMAVVSTAGNPDGLVLFGVPNNRIAQLAIILTFILALTEGIRRLFQFDQRWMTCSRTRAKLNDLLRQYQLVQIPLTVGTEPWISNLTALRESVKEAESEEELGFFSRLKERPEEDQK